MVDARASRTGCFVRSDDWSSGRNHTKSGIISEVDCSSGETGRGNIRNSTNYFDRSCASKRGRGFGGGNDS